MTRAIPISSALLSAVPKIRIAKSFTGAGVRSIAVLPTASNGDERGESTPARRCPDASATAALTRPTTAACGRGMGAVMTPFDRAAPGSSTGERAP
ncbi:hypothetical protein GCM10010470_32950 [Saccharopolyspora taberi]|uniref:Uncharacterized protein n=1 Tax=Saccharopolyspora taberi TaxID=60895 RepID=A0ABN3VDS2_9PSEU